MKEASGELNMAVVVVLLVSGLSIFFFSFLWPNIKTNLRNNSNCNAAICNKTPNSDGKTVTCYPKKDTSHSNPIICTWKG